MVLALFPFAPVIGDGWRVLGRGDERGLPQRVLQALVAAPGGAFAPDAGAGLAGDGRDAGACGQVRGRSEAGDVPADGQEDVARGPGAYPGHRRQDREKRVIVEELLDLGGEAAPPVLDGPDVAGDRGDDGLGHGRSGHGDGLFADGPEHVVDDASRPQSLVLGPLPDLFDAGPAHARGSAVVLEQGEGRVPGGAFALQDAFERGVGLQEQAPQAVDVAGGFVGEVLVVAREDPQGGEGLVVGSRVPQALGEFERGPCDHVRVPAVGLCDAGQELRGPAHGGAGRVGDRHRHAPGHGQGQGSDGVGLVDDQEHASAPGELPGIARMACSSCLSGLSYRVRPSWSRACAWCALLPTSRPTHTSMSSGAIVVLPS